METVAKHSSLLEKEMAFSCKPTQEDYFCMLIFQASSVLDIILYFCGEIFNRWVGVKAGKAA